MVKIFVGNGTSQFARAFHKLPGNFLATSDTSSNILHPEQFLVLHKFWEIGTAFSLPFSLSIQPLTAFAILSYGKRDFAEAEGRKTEIGERCTPRRRGGGRGKKIHTGPERRNLAKETENRRFA